MKRLIGLGMMAAVALLMIQGCQSVQKPPGRGSKDPVTVTLGMPVEELLAQLGEPDRIYPFENDQIDADVWVYRRAKDSNLRMVQTGTQEVPYWDPITGIYRPIHDPILQPEISKLWEITELLIIEGEVVSWKQRQEQDREMMK